jgi:hypothetical protein
VILAPPPQPTLPAVRQAILKLMARHNRNDARTAKNGFATSSGVSKSAKVVVAIIALSNGLPQWYRSARLTIKPPGHRREPDGLQSKWSYDCAYRNRKRRHEGRGGAPGTIASDGNWRS